MDFENPVSGRACALAGVALGLALAAVPASAEKVVRIGVAAPLTGPVATYGKDFEAAVRLAVEDANKAGLTIAGEPARIELVSEDDAADPKQAVSVATRLVDMRVSGVVGHLTSGATIPASRIYSMAGIAQIAPAATNPAYTRQGYKTTFRVIGDDLQVGSALGRYIVETLGLKDVAVVDDRSAFGQGLADVVAKSVVGAGGKVVAREFTNTTATDFRTILTTLKARKPQAIFYGGVNAQAGPLRKQMRELGLAVPLVGSSISSEEFVQFAGKDAAEGTYSGDSGQALEKMPGGAQFKQHFTAKYGDVVMYAPYGYDAANVLINAIKAANSAEPAKVLAQVQKVQFKGITGPIAFDEKGDLRSAAVTFFQVKGGKWQSLETLSTK
jgi:branched-chain amino acid transport system substrate-binding protein